MGRTMRGSSLLPGTTGAHSTQKPSPCSPRWLLRAAAGTEGGLTPRDGVRDLMQQHPLFPWPEPPRKQAAPWGSRDPVSPPLAPGVSPVNRPRLWASSCSLALSFLGGHPRPPWYTEFHLLLSTSRPPLLSRLLPAGQVPLSAPSPVSWRPDPPWARGSALSPPRSGRGWGCWASQASWAPSMSPVTQLAPLG